jgi:hypothetical protein
VLFGESELDQAEIHAVWRRGHGHDQNMPHFANEDNVATDPTAKLS